MWLYTLKTEHVQVPILLDEPEPPQFAGEWTRLAEVKDREQVYDILQGLGLHA